jgi:uncharacterized membrane protein
MSIEQILLNVISAPFGVAALYYGYKGYEATKGGLKAYKYFFLAMVGLGTAMLLDLLRLLGMLSSSAEFLFELSLMIVAVLMLLSFKNLHDFLSKAF